MVDRHKAPSHTEEKMRYLYFSHIFRTIKEKCAKIWRTRGRLLLQMETGKNTETRQNATFATKASTRTSIDIRWKFMILVEGNTAAEATEDVTTKQQKINMCRTNGDNQMMKSING